RHSSWTARYGSSPGTSADGAAVVRDAPIGIRSRSARSANTGRRGRQELGMPCLPFGLVGLQSIGQFLGAAEGDAVAAIDLIRGDAEALFDDPSHELRGEEAVVAAEQESGRHRGPCLERPWLQERCGGLITAPLGRLRRQLGWHVVEEQDGVVVGGPAVVL